MTAAELRRTAAFVLACVVAGMALALLVVVAFPDLAGGALASRLAPRSTVPAAQPPAAAATAPTASAPVRTASQGPLGDPAQGAAPPLGNVAPERRASLSEVLTPQPTFSYAAAVRASAPAVVNVYTRAIVKEPLPTLGLEQFFGGAVQPQYRQRVQNALGSGVVVDSNGHIVTNNHVISGATQIRVQLADGRSADAQVVGSDPDTDLAVLHIGLKDVPVMRLGRSDTLQVGDVVLAIGNPLGLSQTVTHGIVSAKDRGQLGVATYESFIQTDAAINEGNSGGALINARGELVGINTAVLGKQIGAEGIGVAIPVELVRGVLQEIITQGRVIRGWIGITCLDVNERIAQFYNLPAGAVTISGVLRQSPAVEAGLRPRDIVRKVDDHAVRTAQEAMTQIARKRPGSSVQITGTRDGVPFSVRVPVRDPLSASTTAQGAGQGQPR